jgi:hypothetical protein
VLLLVIAAVTVTIFQTSKFWVYYQTEDK